MKKENGETVRRREHRKIVLNFLNPVNEIRNRITSRCFGESTELGDLCYDSIQSLISLENSQVA